MKGLDLQRYQNLADALSDALEKFGSRTSLIEVDRDREKIRISYDELRKSAQRFDAALQSHDPTPDFKMGIIMSNQSKWIIAATGLFYAGGILVPLDYKLTPQEQLALIKHANLQFLVVEFPFWKRLLSADSENILVTINVFVTEAPENEALGSNVIRFEKIPEIRGLKKASRSRNDVACIVYSSGTGGTPKGCMLTHGNYLSQAQSLSELYPIDENDSYFSFIPTNHAIDFMCGFILPLLFGSKIVHQRTLRPEFFASTIQAYQISHMALVPLLLKNLEEKIRIKLAQLPSFKRALIQTLIKINAIVTRFRPWYSFSRLLLSPIHKIFGGHLRLIFAGGAFVESSTAQFFYDLGIPVVIGYGLTEAGTVLTVNDLKPFRADTVGRPLPITTVQIHNPDAFGVGEVWVKGATVMKGYYNAQELTDETIENGWLRTGDLGRWSNGHLVLLGRKKNMIVTQGGKNVYPEDIEPAFDRIPEVEEYCVLAKRLIWPHSNLAHDSMILVVRPKEGTQPESFLDEIKNRNRKLADYKRISETLIWENAFARTASMKIKRNILADEIASTVHQPETKLVSL